MGKYFLRDKNKNKKVVKRELWKVGGGFNAIYIQGWGRKRPGHSFEYLRGNYIQYSPPSPPKFQFYRFSVTLQKYIID